MISLYDIYKVQVKRKDNVDFDRALIKAENYVDKKLIKAIGNGYDCVCISEDNFMFNPYYRAIRNLKTTQLTEFRALITADYARAGFDVDYSLDSNLDMALTVKLPDFESYTFVNGIAHVIYRGKIYDVTTNQYPHYLGSAIRFYNIDNDMVTLKVSNITGFSKNITKGLCFIHYNKKKENVPLHKLYKHKVKGRIQVDIFTYNSIQRQVDLSRSYEDIIKQDKDKQKEE